MWRVILQQNQTFRTLNAQMSRYPAWVTRTAVFCAWMTALPIVLLIAAWLLVCVLVLAVLSLVARVMELFGGGGGAASAGAHEPLRRNVQVIEDDAR